MKALIFHGGAIAACVLALVAVTRRSPYAAVFSLGASILMLAVSSLALGAIVGAGAQVLMHAGGCFALLMAGLLLSAEPSHDPIGDRRGGVIAGLVTALLLGVVLAVKITPLRDLALEASTSRIGELAGVLFGGPAGPGEMLLAVALGILLVATAVFGVRAATRSAR